MIAITLPDGSQRQYPGPVTVAEVAQSIGTGLARVALGRQNCQAGITGNLMCCVDDMRLAVNSNATT